MGVLAVDLPALLASDPSWIAIIVIGLVQVIQYYVTWRGQNQKRASAEDSSDVALKEQVNEQVMLVMNQRKEEVKRIQKRMAKVRQFLRESEEARGKLKEQVTKYEQVIEKLEAELEEERDLRKEIQKDLQAEREVRKELHTQLMEIHNNPSEAEAILENMVIPDPVEYK